MDYKLTLVLAFLSFTYLNCRKSNIEITQPTSITIENQPNSNRFLALGDSYSIGESVSEIDRFPNQLLSRLKAEGTKLDTTLIIAGTGWTTSNLLATISNANLTDTFGLVSLLIGVNNQYQDLPISMYEEEFTLLLSKAIDLAGGDTSKVFVISIPDYGYTPFGEKNQGWISVEIDKYNLINQTIALNFGVSWFDITQISREGLNNPNLIAPDKLHPSGEMYEQWVDFIFEDVILKLQ